jgi:hypothetical protein
MILTEAAMESFRLDLGMGMNPSVKDNYKSLTFTMSITLAALGFINLVVAGSGGRRLDLGLPQTMGFPIVDKSVIFQVHAIRPPFPAHAGSGDSAARPELSTTAR